MALYSDILLDAAKSCSLVDDDAQSLTNEETRRYSVYLKNAIAKFNNNPDNAIGTEKVVVAGWMSDEFGHFARLVREPESRRFTILANEGEGSISRLSARGNPRASLAELPQRLQSALMNFRQGTPVPYYIFNEKQFFEANRSERAVCYTVRENEGIIRTTQPATMLLIFDRAIPFHFGIDNDIASRGSSSQFEQDTMTEGILFTLLQKNIDIPLSHVPYLINLAAYELARGIKLDQELCGMLAEQINSQAKDLLRNNISEKVNLSTTNKDYAFNWWNRRAYR
jgi:hypothetical protein